MFTTGAADMVIAALLLDEQEPRLVVRLTVLLPALAQRMLYGPWPEPLITVPPLKFHVNVVPGAKLPLADTLTGAFSQAVAGRLMVADAGLVMLTEAFAGSEEHPLLVTTRLALRLPALAQLTLTGPAETELAGLPPLKVH